MLICRMRRPLTLGLSRERASNTELIRSTSTPAHPQTSSNDSVSIHLETELDVLASDEQ